MDWFNHDFALDLFKFTVTIVFLCFWIGFALLGEKINRWNKVEASFDEDKNKENMIGMFSLYSALSFLYWGIQGLILYALSSPLWLWILTLIVVPTIFCLVLIQPVVAYAVAYGWSIVIAILIIFNYEQIIYYNVFWDFGVEEFLGIPPRFTDGIVYVLFVSGIVTVTYFIYAYTTKFFDIPEDIDEQVMNIFKQKEESSNPAIVNAILKISLTMLIIAYLAIFLTFFITGTYDFFFL